MDTPAAEWRPGRGVPEPAPESSTVFMLGQLVAQVQSLREEVRSGTDRFANELTASEARAAATMVRLHDEKEKEHAALRAADVATNARVDHLAAEVNTIADLITEVKGVLRGVKIAYGVIGAGGAAGGAGLIAALTDLL